MPNTLSVNGLRNGPAKVAPSTGTGRQTIPAYFNAYSNGLGVVPRRGWDVRTEWLLQAAAKSPAPSLGLWAQTAPLRLLTVLADVHPIIAQCRANNLRLAFAPGDTKIVAVKDRQPVEERTGTGDTTQTTAAPADSVNAANPARRNAGDDDTIDQEGTAALDNLWESLSIETGGLGGLQVALGEMALLIGLATVEAVPGPRGTGVADIATFDPLTVRFRDTPTGRVLEQRQNGDWKELDQSRCFAASVDGTRDNPYGRPLFHAALSEGLRDISQQQNLDDVLRAVAWPRLAVGFPFNEVLQFAIENPDVLVGQAADGGDLTPLAYAEQEFAGFVQKMATVKADDILVYFKDGKVEVLNPATALASMEPILAMQRHRLVMALDELPGLLGITDGGTQAYTTVQWKIRAKKLEWLRAFVNGILVRIANLHLRLMGLPLTARADVEPIQTSDGFTDEQARQLQIQNEAALYQAGLIDREEYAVNLTGHSPAEAEALPLPVMPAPPGDQANNQNEDENSNND